MKTIFLVAATVSVFLASQAFGGEFAADAYHEQNCTRCHNSALYTRENRRVRSYPQLEAQVGPRLLERRDHVLFGNFQAAPSKKLGILFARTALEVDDHMPFMKPYPFNVQICTPTPGPPEINP